MVDCGSNLGVWTGRLSAPEYAFRRFIAVEPNPHLIPILAEKVAANHIDCEIMAAAVTEEAGRQTYLAVDKDHAVASVSDSGVPVETTTLDELVTSEDSHSLIVVKLDVEGSEIPAMKGARRLQGAKLIYIYEDFPRSGWPNTQFLLQCGYRIRGVT